MREKNGDGLVAVGQESRKGDLVAVEKRNAGP